MYLFMTGYPGFIATRLLRELVRRQQFETIYLLVLDTPDQKWVRQAERDVKRDLPDLPITIVAGDIGEPNLGLTDPALVNHLTATEGEWWHLAAVYRLDVPESVAIKVNVEGTQHILELAKRCKKLRRLQYVSTAYVSGARTGPVLEAELLAAREQGFKNFYESTKHEAEQLVRRVLQELPATIYRYAVVVGDSQTGETAKFDGPYFVMRFFNRWGRVPLPRVGPMTTPFNIVPVDFVVQASAAIAARPDTVGKTYHLVDPHPLSSGEIYAGIAQAMGCPRPLGCIPKGMMALLARPKLIQRLLGFPYESIVYMNHGADYDCSEAQAILRQEGVICPSVGNYLPTLVKWYLQNAERKELQIPIG